MVSTVHARLRAAAQRHPVLPEPPEPPEPAGEREALERAIAPAESELGEAERATPSRRARQRSPAARACSMRGPGVSSAIPRDFKDSA